MQPASALCESPDSMNSNSSDDPFFGNPASDLLRGALAMDAEAAVTPVSDRAVWQPPSSEHLAEMLPAYQVLGLIGRGGMGAVYRGVQLSLNRPVAIKLLPAELAASADFVARFQREAQTLARLQHAGIVAVHDFGRTAEGHLYFIMEFVDGTDLAHLLHTQKLEPEQALELTLQICEALQYAHSQGVVHRDIKPANVLLTQDGRAKLADFGLARPLTTTPGMTGASIIMGTPEYMAPEQWAGKVDHRADIYALGVMLYEMLTGTRPQGAFDLPSIKSHVDARLDEVIVKAMRQAPEQRYQHVSELRDAVQRIRTTEPAHANPAPSPPPAPTPRRPSQSFRQPAPRCRSVLDTFGWVAAIVLLLAMAAAVIWVMQHNPSSQPVVAIEEPETLPPPPLTPDPTPKATPEPIPKPAPVVEVKPAPVTPPPPPVLMPPPPVTPPAPAPPAVIEVFSRESQNLIAWALSPLEAEIPADIRQNLTLLREDLVDEGKSKPAAPIPAYSAAWQLCHALLTALDERGSARVAAGYRDAQAAANQTHTNQALNARRNYMMSWPQYAREESHRTELQRQSSNRTAVASEAQKVAWATYSAKLSRSLDTLYAKFREAMRQ